MGTKHWKRGDHVKWHSHAGTAQGRIVEVATTDGHIEGFHYRASPEDPRYIIETDEGKRAAHTADALEAAAPGKPGH